MQFDGQLIAAAIQSRKAWEKIAAHFSVSDFSAISKVWYPLINEWYTRDPTAQSVDRLALAELGKTRIQPKHQDMLVGFIRDLPEAPSPENLVHVALEFKRFAMAQQLGAALASTDESRIAELLPQYDALRKATTLEVGEKRHEWQDAPNIETLFDEVGTANRIAVAPTQLNERIGNGALPGHHIIIFGRPEMGKSTFAINMGMSFVRREIRTMYVGNEDRIAVLKARAAARLTGMTQTEMEAKPEQRNKLFRDLGGEDFLLMTQLAHGSISAIARRVEQWQPQVIIIDQIRNLRSGLKTESMTTRLEALGIEMRGLLLDYGLIGISVTQANPVGNKLFLDLDDMDSSKTGLPAQGDLIVGVNANDEMLRQNQRAISLPKNKLSSAADAHEGFIVNIDKHRSKVY